MAKLSSDVVKGREEISLSESPYMYENDNIYSTIQDEDKVTSANEDEYIEMNPTNIWFHHNSETHYFNSLELVYMYVIL